jgi:hypothetical protein
MSVAKITFGQQCSTLGATARYRMRLLSPDGFLPTGPAKLSGRRRQKPCWQQAGVTSETMQKIGVIRESTRTQIGGWCTDDSLSHQPKLDKVAEVRKSANQERGAVILPRQQYAIHQCELARPHPARLYRQPARSDDPCAGRLSTPAAAPANDAASGETTDPKKPADNPPDADAADPKKDLKN